MLNSVFRSGSIVSHISKFVFLFCAAAIVASCMRPPKFPRRVSVAEVVNNVRCEMYDAVYENMSRYPWLRQWSAGYKLSLTVDRDSGASTDTSYVIPVQHGTFSIGLKANLDRNVLRTVNLNFDIIGLENYDKYDCSQVGPIPQSPRKLLNGEIGLYRWLNRAIPSVEDSNIVNETEGEPSHRKELRKYAGSATGIGYTIEFELSTGGTLSPSWALSYRNGRMFKPGFSLTGNKKVTHKLVFTMTPTALPKPRDLSVVLNANERVIARKVCVTNLGDQSKCADEIAVQSMIDATQKSISSYQSSISKIEIENKELERKISASKNTIRSLSPESSEAKNLAKKVGLEEDLRNANLIRKKSLESKIEDLSVEKVRQSANLEAVEKQDIRVVRAVRAAERRDAEQETKRVIRSLITQQILENAFNNQ